MADGSVRFISETIELDAQSTVAVGTACEDIASLRDVDTTFEQLIGIRDGAAVAGF